MASDHRPTPVAVDLESALAQEPFRFDFFQALYASANPIAISKAKPKTIDSGLMSVTSRLLRGLVQASLPFPDPQGEATLVPSILGGHGSSCRPAQARVTY